MIGILIKAAIGLFGSSKSAGDTISSAATGLMQGVDKLVLTEQEKAEMMPAIRDSFVKFADIAYDQNSIRSITRRWLAFLVVGPTIILYVLAALSYGVSIDYAKFVFDMAKELTPWAGGVLVFYFGPHLIGAGRG